MRIVPLACAVLAACSSDPKPAIDAGGTDTVAADAAVPSQVTYLKGSRNQPYSEFGWSLAISRDGSTASVGAAGSFAAAADARIGRAYVFVRDGKTWREQAVIEPPNGDGNDQFGYSVALSADGSTLAIGAINEASAATGIDGNRDDNSMPFAGAVYVYLRTADSWALQAYVKPSNTHAEQFGTSVSLSDSGDTLAVGAAFEASRGTGVDGDQTPVPDTAAGAAYVFQRTGASWSQQAYIKASNTGPSDQFGASVSLAGDGDTLAVGAWNEASAATGLDGDQTDDSAGTAGAAYVFSRALGVWTQRAYVKPSNTASNMHFAESVALAGDGLTLVAGARGSTASGAVYAFVRDGTTWAERAILQPSSAFNATVGFRVGIDATGGTIVTSAANDCNVTSTDAGPPSGFCGAAYVMRRAGSSWSVAQRLEQPRLRQSDAFGENAVVSGDGRTALVGAKNESGAATTIDGNQDDTSADHAGAAYAFALAP